MSGERCKWFRGRKTLNKNRQFASKCCQIRIRLFADKLLNVNFYSESDTKTILIIERNRKWNLRRRRPITNGMRHLAKWFIIPTRRTQIAKQPSHLPTDYLLKSDEWLSGRWLNYVYMYDICVIVSWDFIEHAYQHDGDFNHFGLEIFGFQSTLFMQPTYYLWVVSPMSTRPRFWKWTFRCWKSLPERLLNGKCSTVPTKQMNKWISFNVVTNCIRSIRSLTTSRFCTRFLLWDDWIALSTHTHFRFIFYGVVVVLLLFRLYLKLQASWKLFGNFDIYESMQTGQMFTISTKKKFAQITEESCTVLTCESLNCYFS